MAYYEELGFLTAIDDVGAGHSGLGLLADFQTHIVKFDMGLIQNVSNDPVGQSIVCNSLNIFRDLKITALAEGIETEADYGWLKDNGITLMQGTCLPNRVLRHDPRFAFPSGYVVGSAQVPLFWKLLDQS